MLRLPGAGCCRRAQDGRSHGQGSRDHARRGCLPAPAGPRRGRSSRGTAAQPRTHRARSRGRVPALQAPGQYRSHASLPQEDDAGLRGPRPEGTGRSMTSLGGRIKSLRAERGLQQRQLAEKAGMTPSMVSQIESGRLTPSLPTLGKLAAALGVPIASLFETARNGRLHVSRKSEYPVVSFDGTTEKWHVLGAGLFQGKIRAVVSTLGPRAKGVKTDKVVIDPGQMKLFYVLEGKVALHYNGDTQHLEAGDSAYLDGGTPHGWENIGTQSAKALWVILG